MTNQDSHCKYCHSSSSMAKSHVIPESFYRAITWPDDRLRLYEKGEYSKRAPIGIYDTNLLCHDCEKDPFSTYDDYAAKVLIEDKYKKEPIRDSGRKEKLGYYLLDVDHSKLKLFFLSVLWRCDRSNRREFNGISLGSDFDKLDSMLKSEDPGNYNDYSLMLFDLKYPDYEDKDVMFMFFPRIITLGDGLKYCEINMGKYICLIKVDTRNVKQNQCILGSKDKFAILYHNAVEWYGEEALRVITDSM